jgi:hypothetical protein
MRRLGYCLDNRLILVRLQHHWIVRRGQLKCDGTNAKIIFRLSAKRSSPFKSAGASVQSTAGSRGVRISVSNAGYTMFRGSVKSTGYPLRSPVSPSLPLPCVTVCHHISTGVYHYWDPPNLLFNGCLEHLALRGKGAWGAKLITQLWECVEWCIYYSYVLLFSFVLVATFVSASVV